MILGRGEQKTAAETAPLAGGRRREALLRSQSDQARAQRLTAADVATLQGDPSPDGRAKVAAKFGRQFEELATSPQRDLALAVLQLLVRDVAKEVRLTPWPRPWPRARASPGRRRCGWPATSISPGRSSSAAPC